MHVLIIVLRFLHIVSGAVWLGSAVIMIFFVGPTAAAMGDAGPKFMGHLVTHKKVSVFISAMAGLTVLAGASLFWIDSEGLTSAWMHSGPGTVFTIGAVFGLIGFIFGIQGGVNVKKMTELGSQIQGKPTDEQMALMQSLQKKAQTAGPIGAYAILISAVCMSVARYWF